MDLYTRIGLWLQLILCCDSVDMERKRFAEFPIDRILFCIRRTDSTRRSSMFPVCRLVMSILQLTMHRPSALFDRAGMLHKLVVFLEICMSRVDTVHIVYRCLIVDLMHIRRDILLLSLLRLTVLFVPGHTINMRTILRLVGRIHDRMIDTIHFLNPSICQVGNVLLKNQKDFNEYNL